MASTRAVFKKQKQQQITAEKKPYKRPVKKRIAFYFAAALIMVCLLSNLTGKTAAYFRLRSEMDNLHQQIGELEMENQIIQDEIAAWDNPEFLERQAREKLGMIEEGEISFWVVD